MLLHHTAILPSPWMGFLWLLALTGRRASAQYCVTDEASLTGTSDFGSEFKFRCVEGAYVSSVQVAKDVGGLTGLQLTCSDGEDSEVFGSCVACDILSHKVDCSGGWTGLSTVPDLDNTYPAEATFFCYNEDNPSGASLGPYP